eukprot:Em0022g684a
MLRDDVIQPSSSPWASPIVLATKKDGSPRFCVDYRKLNEVTQKDAYPLPQIDETLETLAESQLFSTLDLASGYWQVELGSVDRQKTAFCTAEGLYKFKVMPFGLCNAPATFERLMSMVLSGLQWSSCLVYLDDIIVMEEVRYLGHIVSKDGIAADPEKTAKVQHWPIPASTKEVQQFLGLANYYRCYPNFKLPFLLNTDASNDAIGAVLSQLDEQGNEWVLAYASRLLSKAESNYCVTRKELLSVVSFTAHFRPYVLRHRFTLRTDHAPLTWLYGVKEPEGQVARWLEQLQELDFKIIHRPGQRHQNADAHSRLPCRQCSHTGEDDKNNESATIATLQLSSYVSANIKDKQMEDQELQLVITAQQSNEHIAPAQEAAQSLELRRLHQVSATNSWFHDACKIMFSKKFMKSDGLVKRFNRTLLSMLATCLEDHLNQWDQYLSKLCMAYNSSFQSNTGYSPYFLMFGRDARLPMDIIYDTTTPDGIEQQPYAAYVKSQHALLTDAFRRVWENTGQKYSFQKEIYNKKVHGQPLVDGDMAWLFNPAIRKGQPRKLHKPWSGPYRIRRKMSEVTYQIQHTGNHKLKVVHFNRLKRCPNNIRLPA